MSLEVLRCPVCGHEESVVNASWPPVPCPTCLAHWLIDQGVPRMMKQEDAELERKLAERVWPRRQP